MIEVKVNDLSFEYDMYTLLRAFYPKEEVTVKNIEAFQEEANIQIEIVFEKTKISMKIYEDKNLHKESEIEIEEEVQGVRIEIKNRLKRLIYRELSEYKKQQLPWGTLTGIRPVKIPMALLEQGKTNVEIAKHMRETYFLSNEKTALAVSIANKEREVLKDVDYKEGYSLYIGIPFCPSICLYCSFSSSPIALWEKKTDLYLDALCKELEFVGESYSHKKLNTIYVGGGTPTTLSANQLDRLLNKIEESFSYADLQELTVEAGRPDSVTREKLEVLKKHKVDRISVNPQTMNQETLDIIGRKHTVDQTREAFALAREVGFTNINMDLIVGLPGEKREDVEYTMKELHKMQPDSVTVHSLAVKRAARLKLFQEKYEEMGVENSEEIMQLTYEACVTDELYPYYLYRQKNMAGNFENVGYAKEGKAGIYNILIMEEKQTILAVGAGAATKFVFPDHIERVENVKDVTLYINRIDEMIERKRSFMEKNDLFKR